MRRNPFNIFELPAACLLAVIILLGSLGDTMAAKGYRLKKTTFGSLTGWKSDNHADAFTAFRRSCEHKAGTTHKKRYHGLAAICRDVLRGPSKLTRVDARRFFEQRFDPYLIIAGGSSKGLFTGYYEPEYDGALEKSPDYGVPILSAPDNLIDLPGKKRPKGFPRHLTSALKMKKGLKPVPTRKQIENGALKALVQPIAWLADPVDAFFLHIQGSGRVRLPDGNTIRLAFAGRNGHPYSSIGRRLQKTGILKKNQLSMQSVQGWLRRNPVKARKVLHSNKSYIFFRQIYLDKTLGPVGGQGVPLTAGRSLAIDRRFHRYGLPVWVDTRVPDEKGRKFEKFRRVMIAQDTGSAIKGPIRGDIFFGTGKQAGAVAGRVKERGRMHVLLPKPLGKRR